MFHCGGHAGRGGRAGLSASVVTCFVAAVAAACLFCVGRGSSNVQGAQVVEEPSATDAEAGDDVVASGTAPTKYLLVSSFKCPAAVPACDFEDAVLRYDAVTGAFIAPHIPNIAGPYGIALHPRRETLLVVSKDDNAVYEYKARTGAFIRKLISAGPEGLNLPQSIVVKANGNLLVTSTQAESTLTKFNGILEFNGNTGAFVSPFVNGGSVLFESCADPHCLRGPNGMALGPPVSGYPNGQLYVASGVNHSVLEYDGVTGAYLGVLDATKLISPIGVLIRPASALRPGNIHMTSKYPDPDPVNTLNDTILEFSKTTRELVATGGGEFVKTRIRPGALAWAADGNLLVGERTGDLSAFNYSDRIVRRNKDTGGSLIPGTLTATTDTNIHFATAMFEIDFNFADDDIENDGDVDLFDLAAFQNCSGRSSPLSTCTGNFDDNLSGRIGNADFVAFFQKLRGPHRTCVNAADCTDGNACTNDTCVAGQCTYAKVADGTPCPDSLFCNGSESCSAGFCAPAPPCVDQAHCDEVNDRCLPCIANSECNDNNPCTNDTCVPGIGPGTGCQHQNNTISCDDGNQCTTTDRCSGGVCVGGPSRVCNDGNLCTDDSCNPSLGCSFVHNLAPCDDGNICTLDDQCLQGTCSQHSNLDCDDRNLCTTDSCHPTLGCRNINNTDPCDDHNQCTSGDECSGGVCRGGAINCDDGVGCTNDTCAGGVCVFTPMNSLCDDGIFCNGSETCDANLDCRPGTPPNCNDNNPCTDDSCSGASCQHINNTAPCNDNNACTLIDTCQGGSCVGSPVVCIASDQCHNAGTCAPATGVCSNPTKPNGTACNDGNACTQTDTCQAGSCVGSNAVVCTASDQCHTAGTCAPATGLCSNPAKANGTACNDGNACMQTDTCQAGSCLGSNPVICTASDQCHTAGTCAPATGVCSNPAKANGTACNDSNACTGTDTCQSGSCVGSNPIVCTALDQCHDAGTCAPATGVCSNPNKANGTTCSDGNACTQTDACQDGNCIGSNSIVCTASDQCHDAGTCNPATGLCSNPNSPNGTPCGDSSSCTQTDTCQAGSCVGGNNVVCSASDQCHVAGICDPLTGLCSNPNSPNGTSCNDGNACTQTDTCQAGSCVGGNGVVCSASDQCHDAGVCDPLTGLCSDPELPNGTSCDDGDECTQTDTCQAGNCVGGNDVVCSASDQCHDAGVCDPLTGLCSDPPSPNGTACNDGDACTLTDTCQAGSCDGSNLVVCTALDDCHEAGVCDSGTGVCSNPESPNGTACDDGDDCTDTDTCSGGVCAGTAYSCDDSDVCTDDSCNGDGTCTFTPIPGCQ